jgi:predicted PurR-regulated permease PerM
MSETPSPRPRLRARGARSTRPPEPVSEAGGDASSINPTARYVLIGLAVLSVALMATIIYPFASALLFAAVLAGALHPWQERLSARFKGRRQLAAALLTLAVLVLLVVPVATVTVSLGRQVVEGIGFVRDALREGGLPALVEKLPPSLRGLGDRVLAQLPHGQEQIQELAGNQTGRAAAAVGGILRATSSILFQIAMMLVGLFFLLVDGPTLVAWIGRITPLGRERTLEVLSDFRNVSVAVLVSSVATAGVQSVVAFVGYLIARVPQPLFFAAVTFVIAFIPALGATSVTLLVSLLLLASGHTKAAIFLAAWGIFLVGFSDNIVKPLLMRGRMEVHGAVIFFALLGGLAAFGPVGLIAGPLVLAFFLAVVRMCQRDLGTAPS